MAAAPPTRAQAILTWIKSAFLDNLGLKLFSLLIALLLWAFVLGAEDVTTTAEVSVFFKVPEDKVLVTDVPTRIKVTVKGPWAAIKSWNPDNLRKGIDLSDFDLGLSVVYFEETLFELPQSLKVVRITPNKWEVILARKAFKEVPLTQVPTGIPAPGYAVKSVALNPKEVKVEGPEADLEFLNEITTEPVNVDDARESFTTTTRIGLEPRNIRILNQGAIQVTVIVKKDIIEKTFAEIPVRIVNSAYLTDVIPASIPVTISGPRPIIDAISDSQINAFIDATKEEGDKPKTITTREVEFGPLPPEVKIRASSYMVKLTITETPKDEVEKTTPEDAKPKQTPKEKTP